MDPILVHEVTDTRGALQRQRPLGVTQLEYERRIAHRLAPEFGRGHGVLDEKRLDAFQELSVCDDFHDDA